MPDKNRKEKHEVKHIGRFKYSYRGVTITQSQDKYCIDNSDFADGLRWFEMDEVKKRIDNMLTDIL